MIDSGNYNIELIKNKACGYIYKNRIIYKVPLIINPIPLLGSGDLYSTLEDMYKWDQSLHSGKIITKQSLDSMFTSHIVMQDNQFRAHGYGFFIDKKFGRLMIEYSGALIDYLSKYMKFIDKGITIYNIYKFRKSRSILQNL